MSGLVPVKELFKPASLRQLMLFGFALALVPLAVLLWQGSKSLNELNQLALTEAQNAVATVRRAENLKNRITDIERAVRQYEILKTDSLKSLAQGHIVNYLESLGRACADLPEQDTTELCDTQSSLIDSLSETFHEASSERLDTLFSEIWEHQSRLSTTIGLELDKRLEQQQARASLQEQHLAIQTVLLVLLTLVLLIWASGQVAAPVKRLDRMIRAIGQQKDTLSPEQIGGPRELNDLGHRLHWLSGRLQQLESLRVVLLRHASHELKTPLASIREGCSLLAEQLAGPMNDRQMEIVHLLNGSAERLHQLTEQLLDYNRLLQQASPELSTVEAKPLLEQALAEHSLALQQRGLKVHLDCSVAKLHTDTRLFCRILDNLLNNAQAYGAENGQIWVRLHKSKSYIVLEVANTGPSIPEGQEALMFEPFQRGELLRADRVQGSGLGLSIVADCARLLQGQAAIVKHDNADVCVQIKLPQLTDMDKR
ncbi:sensor histidine kinase [Nitrincola sp. MINF-07-Sa-05]|uniref:sensor histidine kinase n=1 Tax=Nitrincola salilacus TaxID=3400273 RepID=UPI003917D357